MAMVRKHWKALLLSLTLMSVSVACGWFVVSSFWAVPAVGEVSEGGESQPGQQTDPLTFSEVQSLRQALSLTNVDLAAMGCSEGTATNVLGVLLAWYGSHKAELEAAHRERADADRSLREAKRQVSMGPRDEGLLASEPALESAYLKAIKAETDLIEKLVPSVDALLSVTEKEIWQTARANKGLPGPYRYVAGLTGPQQTTLTKSLYTAKRKLALGLSDGGEGDATESLSASQRSELETVKANIQQKMPGVLKASQSVLPIPRGLPYMS